MKVSLEIKVAVPTPVKRGTKDSRDTKGATKT